MSKSTHHMSINLEGLLRNSKGKKIKIFYDENGKQVSDLQARKYIQECLAKGWKLIPMGGEGICEGFDYSGKGCPGHPIPDDATEW